MTTVMSTVHLNAAVDQLYRTQADCFWFICFFDKVGSLNMSPNTAPIWPLPKMVKLAIQPNIGPLLPREQASPLSLTSPDQGTVPCSQVPAQQLRICLLSLLSYFLESTGATST